MVTFSCDSCSAINATSAKFCNNCGASLVNLSNLNNAKNNQSAINRQNYSNNGAPVSEFVFAGFWKRLVAYIIDIVLFTLVFMLVVPVMRESLFAMQPGNLAAIEQIYHYYFYFYGAWWLYFSLMETSSLQGTFGKKIIGIKVVDESGQRIGFGKATLRHLSAILSSIILSIGYLMAAFTRRKQALHDIVSGSLVVNKRYEPSQIKVASENPGNGMSTGGIIAVVFLVLLIPIGGILTAIAIPAYKDYVTRAKVVTAISTTEKIKWAFSEHASETGYWPNTFESLGLLETDYLFEKYRIVFAGNGAYQILFMKPLELENMRLNFVPELQSDGNYKWNCFSDDIADKVLPTDCRKNKL